MSEGIGFFDAVLSRKYWSNLRKSTDKSHIDTTQKL